MSKDSEFQKFILTTVSAENKQKPFADSFYSYRVSAVPSSSLVLILFPFHKQ